MLTQVRSGLAGRLMLLAIEGSHQDELARLSKALGEGLRKNSQIDFVGNGMQALSPEERQVLFRSRYLLSRTSRCRYLFQPTRCTSLSNNGSTICALLSPR